VRDSHAPLERASQLCARPCASRPLAMPMERKPSFHIVMHEVLDYRGFWRAVVAEGTAMFFFIFIAVGTAIQANQSYVNTAGIVIPTGFGLTIFVLIHIFGHISGAHINPAVTLALVLARQVPPLRGFAYLCAHVTGSIAASGVLLAIFNRDILGGFNTIPLGREGEKNIAAACVTEIITTMVLIYSVFATIDPKRNVSTELGPLAIGGAVLVCHLIGVPVTGCGINPARSLGPAIFGPAVAREDLWVFIVCPLVGSVIVAISYPFWFADKPFPPGGLRARYAAVSHADPESGGAESEYGDSVSAKPKGKDRAAPVQSIKVASQPTAEEE